MTTRGVNDLRKELINSTREEHKLEENKERKKYWYRWGPYLSERAWATVREDYSSNGDAWDFFPFEHANSRVFRWGEDGIFGVSDNRQLLCMNVALWNGKDERLKERLFGLTNHQGNHGEDVKEIYFYLDNTPSHSYMKSLYKYPFTKPFPYKELIDKNTKRGYHDKEYEVYEIDGLYRNSTTDDTPYFDVVFEMAKGDENPEDLNFRITVHNRSRVENGSLYVIPQVFFRNVWAWKSCPDASELVRDSSAKNVINVNHHKFGGRKIVFQPSPSAENSSSQEDIDPELLFTANESNLKKLFGNKSNPSPFTKDAIEEYIVNGDKEAVNPANNGTKAAAVYHFKDIPPGEYVTLRYKFSDELIEGTNLFSTEDLAIIDEDVFDGIFSDREREADNFYWRVNPLPTGDDLRIIQRQAFAGLLWSKQFYNFIWEDWYNGDVSIKPPPPKDRAGGRNKNWKHLYINDILSMPDKWEYPFFASWDTAFHTIPFAMIDPGFAKKQLDVMTREWYMHPNGQMPAYEWNFEDVNPPVHVWAVYRVYKIERNLYGKGDRIFLERVFQKLLLNFTWWVNRKDAEGNNVFEGGFLGLDNIGIFNRSEALPTGGKLDQADSTGWMAFYCLQMLNIALELAIENPVYEDIASKFFEHFILISDSLSFERIIDNTKEGFPEIVRQNLWNEDDQFYYDAISWGGPHKQQLRVRSLVGLIPLYASMTLEDQVLCRFPNFKKRVDWYIENKSEVVERNIASMRRRGVSQRMLLSLVNADRLKAILQRMLDENEFFSIYGIRSLSKYHEKHPFEMNVNGNHYEVKYLPGESDSGMFGGNSNWRGPIWFPTNFLLVEALQRFHLYYGNDFKVECPSGSGRFLNLAEVAVEISSRMIQLFVPNNDNGERACYDGPYQQFLSRDEYFKDLVPFFEYFDGDTGRGLGASHQCGWTALVAKWISDVGISFLRTRHRSEDSESILRRRHMRRRKSGRSLLSFTATALDLTEDEKNLLHAQQSVLNVLSPQSSVTSAKSAELKEDMLFEEDRKHELNSSDAHKSEMKLIEHLRNKFNNFSFGDNSGDNVEENKPELACQYDSEGWNHD